MAAAEPSVRSVMAAGSGHESGSAHTLGNIPPVCTMTELPERRQVEEMQGGREGSTGLGLGAVCHLLACSYLYSSSSSGPLCS